MASPADNNTLKKLEGFFRESVSADSAKEFISDATKAFRYKENDQWTAAELKVLKGGAKSAATWLSEEVPSDVRLLWLTGTGSINFKPEQIARLKRYLEDGGMLFIDQAAGKGRIFIKARAMLQKTFGPERVKRIPNNSPLLSGAFAGGIGSDVRRVAYTYTIAARQPRLRMPLLWGVEQDGRLAVVLSPYAVTCPVEGIPVYGLQGLLTDDARRLAGNIVLYAALER